MSSFPLLIFGRRVSRGICCVNFLRHSIDTEEVGHASSGVYGSMRWYSHLREKDTSD